MMVMLARLQVMVVAIVLGTWGGPTMRKASRTLRKGATKYNQAPSIQNQVSFRGICAMFNCNWIVLTESCS